MVKNLARDSAGYFHKLSKVTQVPLIAERVAEPSHDRAADMLEVLPAAESAYYAKEENVISVAGKCSVHVEALAEQYGFWGGELSEIIKYSERSDLPASMWG